MTQQPDFLTRPEVNFAMEVVQQAARLAQRVQAEMIAPSDRSSPVKMATPPVPAAPVPTAPVPGTSLSKTDRSPVTVADFAIQAFIARRLMQTFPDHQLMAEEDASTLRTSVLLDKVTAFVSEMEPDASPTPATPQAVCDWIDWGHTGTGDDPTWILDPIDGTKGFLRGGQYAVALALMVDGQVQVGVLGCPNLAAGSERFSAPAGSERFSAYNIGTLAVAVRGAGSWMRPMVEGSSFTRRVQFTRLEVSNIQDPVQARLLRSFEAGHTNVSLIEQFVTTLGIQADPVPMDSQVKYAVLAAGQGDLMLRLLSTEQPNYREKAWDQAAGSLVVEEAGGCVTDLDGNQFDFTTGRELTHNRGVLVSNGWLHDAALQALKTVRA